MSRLVATISRRPLTSAFTVIALVVIGLASVRLDAISELLTDSRARLALIETKVRGAFPAIGHVQPTDVDLSNPDIVLVDVREPGEYAVSHLPGAVQISPNADVDEVTRRLGDVTGKRVVFYCSVGYRSSMLAERAAEALQVAGADAVENLSGGIFRWHNDQRPLVANAAPTSMVHPYNAQWSVFVARRDLTAYSPRRRATASGSERSKPKPNEVANTPLGAAR